MLWIVGVSLAPQEMFDLYCDYLQASSQVVEPLPKSHLLLHLFDRTLQTGNPKTFAFFRDESLNIPLKDIAKKAYAAVFHQRVLSYFKLGQIRKLLC